MGRYKEVQQLDFSGGTNVVSNPYVLTPKQVTRTRNLLLDEHGSLRTRDGYTVVTTSPDTTSPIVFRGVLNTTDGTVYSLALQNNSTNNTLYRTDQSPWTPIGSFVTPYTVPDMVTVVNTGVFAPGYETPWQFNGSTLLPLTATAGQTVPPGAQHVAFHLGSVWVWNTAQTTISALDGPSSLRMSDANNPNSWPNANQTFVAKDDGQVGMGMASYTIVETGISPTATLVLFKNYSAYQVTGVFGASNFSTQKIKTDMGCLAPRTIQFVSGFGIVRLSHKGFALYNGVDDRLISEEVRPYIFGDAPQGITGLNFAALNRAYAAQSQDPPLYAAACPVAGNALSRLFVYDLVRRAWTICDFPINFQCLSLYATPSTTPIMHAGTDTGGQIVSLFGGANDDNGTAITWSFRTASKFGASPLSPTYWRRMILMLFFNTTTTVTATFTLAGLTATVAKTQTYTPTSTGSAYGTAVYGTGTYGTTGYTEARKSFDILRTAPGLFVDVTGAGPVRVRGLAFHAVPQPANKVTA